jgi:LacI family transcriptional regulator
MTVHELAKKLGVSPTTVSAALTGNGRISEKTRQRVLAVANEANFSPNPHARRLRWQGGNDTVCLLSLGLASGVVIEKIVLLQRALIQQGFNAPIHSLGWATEEKNLVDDVRLMRETCLQKPRAIILNSYAFTPRALAVLEQYQTEGGIVVCYDQAASQFDNVIFDRRHNTYLATSHLLELGHRSILFTVYPGALGRDQRYLGYRQALREHHIPPRTEWLFPSSLYQEERGHELAIAFQKMQKKTTAACIINDYAAGAFISEMLQQGYSIPQDISVIGHDNASFAPYAAVPLTTVTHPTEEIVDAVLQLLDNRLSNSAASAPRKKIIRGELVIRQSTAPRGK